MTDRPLFQGDLVRLTSARIATDTEVVALWSTDSLFWRLLSSDPVQPDNFRKFQEDMQKMSPEKGEYSFWIRTLTEDRLIGFATLDHISIPHGEGWLGIGIGDRNYWGKGYGTDTIRLVLRFAFRECNLHRVSLTVFSYNLRALTVYKKMGFMEEGRIRDYIHRDGKRWDMIYMGLLQSEWQDYPE